MVAVTQVPGATASEARYHCQVLLAEDAEGVQLDGRVRNLWHTLNSLWTTLQQQILWDSWVLLWDT